MYPIDFASWWRAFLDMERLYPRVLPLNLWRAWELALYRQYPLPEPVLDLGCGDGRFFRAIWPRLPQADGLDFSETVTRHARWLGVYHHVLVGAAQALPLAARSYAALFSNCAFEHMDDIERVFAEAARVVRPGGAFLFSVMTAKTVTWEMMGPLARALGAAERGASLWENYREYHHLVNPLPQEMWLRLVEQAGFQVVDAWPILTEPFARLFMLLDELWHAPASPDGEIGVQLLRALQQWPRYANGLQSIFAGMWALEPPQADGEGAGLVVYARRRDVPAAKRVVSSEPRRACWCGSTDLQPVSAAYDRCSACGTWIARHPGETSPTADAGAPPSSLTPWLAGVDWLVQQRLPGASVQLFAGATVRPTIEALLTLVGYSVRSATSGESGADIVVLAHTLEHAPDPVAYLRSALAALAPQGVLLVWAHCPAVDEGPVAGEARPRYLFTPAGLQRLLTAAFPATVVVQSSPCEQGVVWAGVRPQDAPPPSPQTSEDRRLSGWALLSRQIQQRTAEVQHLTALTAHYANLLQAQRQELARLRQAYEQCRQEVAERQAAIDQCLAELERCAEQLQRKDALLQELQEYVHQTRLLIAALQTSAVYRWLRRVGRWEEIALLLQRLQAQEPPQTP